jgi:hypothetical protein
VICRKIPTSPSPGPKVFGSETPEHSVVAVDSQIASGMHVTISARDADDLIASNWNDPKVDAEWPTHRFSCGSVWNLGLESCSMVYSNSGICMFLTKFLCTFLHRDHRKNTQIYSKYIRIQLPEYEYDTTKSIRYEPQGLNKIFGQHQHCAPFLWNLDGNRSASWAAHESDHGPVYFTPINLTWCSLLLCSWPKWPKWW